MNVKSNKVYTIFSTNKHIINSVRKLLSTIPLSKRLGKDFWLWYAFFEESEHWSTDSIRYFQFKQLRELLRELKKTSKFYQRILFDVDIESIDNLRTFQEQIPTLHRSHFKDNYSDILSSTWRKQRVIGSSTSGTTGQALKFFYPAEDTQREWAAICHQWKRVGYVPGKSKRAEFKGIVTNSNCIEYYPEKNKIRCSIRHFSVDSIRRYGHVIQNLNIQFFHGYPSAIYLLATNIIRHGLIFPQPHAVLLASEIVYDWQLDKIMHVFPDAKLFAHYGCAERTVLAGWCEYNHHYHVLPQYSLVEVDSDNSEIIGTNLFNKINGFVRYRMKDSAIGTNFKPCPECGRPYSPVIEQIGGRTEDYIYCPKYGWIPPAVVTYPLKGINCIKEIQFFQEQQEELVIRYSVSEHTNSKLVMCELQGIRAGLHDLLGENMKFRFEHVSDFERGATGKFKWIVSKLDREF